MASDFDASILDAASKEVENAVKARMDTVAHVGVKNFTRSDHSKLEPDDWRHTTDRDNITPAEVQLAKRCHGAHIETLSQDVTQVGSHYQLIHYDIPYLDPEMHVLRVEGLVEQELELSMQDLRGRPASTQSVLMACAGTGRMSLKKRLWTHVPWGPDSFGCAKWTGCSLKDVLLQAGIRSGAAQVVFTGADRGVEGNKVQHFQRSLSLDDAMLGHVMLVYQMNGADLVPAHGAPVRLIVPGWYGMASVKWLTKIEVTDGSWWGHQMEAYSFMRAANDTERVPVSRLPVRALMVPPGCPDFFSRTRVLAPGEHRVVGRAWAGAVDIERVEFSSDAGETWVQGEVGEKTGLFGWTAWHCTWKAEAEGVHVLKCRAFDKKGRSQDEPSDDAFNWTAMGDTQPQMVYVMVDKRIDTVGSEIDLVAEQRAARQSLNDGAVGGRLLEPHHVDALYRSPGSQ